MRKTNRQKAVAAWLIAAVFLGRPGQAQTEPGLAIRPAGETQVQLTWSPGTNFNVLQQTPELTPTNSWMDVPDAPEVMGMRYSVFRHKTNSAAFYRLVNRGWADPSSPPDPASVATAPKPNVFNDLGSLTAFLYTGSNAVQVGVAPGTIKSVQASVLRGRVLRRDNLPLPGVLVAILGHPEYGYTYTQTNGMFDLAVNGASYTVEFQAIGFCPAQRQMQVPAQNYGRVPDVVLVPLDPVASSVQFGSNAPQQLALSSPQTDASGTRAATVFFPAGTTATMEMPDGSTQPVGNLTIRVTEFTVGRNGPAAMPAALPPSSGYTYCAEFSGDEALAIGATAIHFSRPVPVYVDNFLGVPVGTLVPVGFYDRSRGVWAPSSNGIVMQVLGSTNGAALIDLHGIGQPETADTLAANGFTAEELQSLAGLYPAGKTLWRAPVPHFSTIDFNYGISGPVPKRPNKPGDKPKRNPCDDSPKTYGGLNFSAQTFTERIPLVGVPFALNYSSARVPDYRVDNQITVPVAWQPPADPCGSLPSGVVCAIPPNYFDPPSGISVETDIAGQQTVQLYPGTNQVATISWDGRDGYGRLVGGSYLANIVIAYQFDRYYYFAACCGPEFSAQFPALFGNTGNLMAFEGHVGDLTLAVGGAFQRLLTYVDQRNLGLGGWSPNPLHRLDPTGGILYYGDGRIRSVPARPPQDSPITELGSTPKVIACGPDGTVYTYGHIRDAAGFTDNYIVRRAPGSGYELVTADRYGTPGVVGPQLPGGGWSQVDGKPANLVSMNGEEFQAMSVGPDGSLYVADLHAIARLTPDGIWHVILGLAPPGAPVLEPDGTLATQSFPTGGGAVNMAVGPDSSVYFSCRWDSVNGTNYTMVRKIAPDGRLYTVFGGGGVATTNLDSLSAWDLFGTAAYSAPFYAGDLGGLAVGEDGTVYVSAWDWKWTGIFKISPGGVILPFLNGSPKCSEGYYDPDPKNADTTAAILGDQGKLATEVTSTSWLPYGLQVGPDGSVYFLNNAVMVWRVNPNGIVERVAGRYASSVSPPADLPADNGDPLNAFIYAVSALAVTPDGSVFVARYGNNHLPIIYNIPGRSSQQGIMTPIGGQNIPSEDGAEVYVFGPDGRHLGTLDSLTGAAKWTFGYDTNSLVATMTDLSGNVTRIERDASGNPTAIVGPYGQRTTLGLDANGFLSTVTNPAHETTRLTNGAGGLLLSITGPRGGTYSIAYDDLGRATQITDPLGGGWIESYSELGVLTNNSYEVDITSTDSLGNTLARQMLLQPEGDTFVYYSANGQATETGVSYRSGNSMSYFGDSTIISTAVGADPRFGNQVQQPVQTTLRLPGGLVYQQSVQQSVGLSSPLDPLSVTGLTNIITVNTNTYIQVYNPTNQTVTATSPMGRTGTTTLDAHGRLIQISAPGWPLLNITYDTLGRVAAVTNSSSVGALATTFAYDSLGRLSTATDPLGATNAYAYDGAGRLRQQTMADGSVAGFTHDSGYNVSSVTPPGRPAHTFEYSAVGLLTNYTPPLAGESSSVSYQYNTEQQLTRASFPDGQINSFQRGAGGRIDAQTLGSGESLAYAYGGVLGSGYRQLTNLSSSSGNSLQLGYCGAILTNMAWSGAVTGQVSMQLNTDLIAASLSVDSSAIAFRYDHDLLLTQAGGLELTRDPASGFITATSLGGVADGRVFDDRGLLTNYIASVNNTSVWSVSSSYDLIARLTNKVETLGGVTRTFGYVYDLAGRLAQVWKDGVLAASYSYDLNGNRLTRNAEAAVYDTQDRVQTYAGAEFGWSPNGTLRTQTKGNLVTTYAYDLRGHLTAVGLPDGRQVGYILDPVGHRIGKTLNDALSKGWLWAGAFPTAEVDSNSQLTAQFVYASRPNAPDYMVKGASTFRLLSDERGSIRLVVNTADGTVAQELDYDEFGRVVKDSNPGFQPFGFAGGLYDPDTGLIRFGLRDYCAETGQWTARDPIRFAHDYSVQSGQWSASDPVRFARGGSSLYAYVRNDPLNWIDPLGTGPFSPWAENPVSVFLGGSLGGGEGFGFTSSFGMIIDSRGNLGLSLSGGGGVILGASLKVVGTASVSQGDIYSTQGRSTVVGGTVGEGLVGGIDGIWNANGQVTGVSINGGFGVEGMIAEGHGFETGSAVFGLGNAFGWWAAVRNPSDPFGAYYKAQQPKPNSPCP